MLYTCGVSYWLANNPREFQQLRRAEFRSLSCKLVHRCLKISSGKSYGLRQSRTPVQVFLSFCLESNGLGTMPVRFSPKGIGLQCTCQLKLNKLVMFLVMACARFERQFLAAPSFFCLVIGFLLPL